MGSADISERLEVAARRICDEYDVRCVYFARILGKRRHHLGGWGSETFRRANEMILTDNVSVFWQGDIRGERLEGLRRSLDGLAAEVEAEFDLE